MRVQEASGRTVDEAVAKALQRMGLTHDQVDVDVIREGRRGVLGIGAEDAIVRVTAKASVSVLPPPRGRGGRPDRPAGSGGGATAPASGEGGSRRGRRGGRGRGGAGAGVGEDGPTRPSAPSDAPASTDARPDDDDLPPTRAATEPAASGPSRFAQSAPARGGQPRGRDGGNRGSGGRRDSGRDGQRGGPRDSARDGDREGQRGGRGGYRAGAISSPGISGPTDEPPIPIPGTPDDLPASPPEGLTDEVEFAGRTLRDILTLLGLTRTEITGREPATDSDSPSVISQVFDVYGEDEDETEELGALIGRRGETLQALQYLINVITSGKYNSEHMFGVDVDGYRLRREEALIAMAKRIAAEVRESGDVITLEPMPAAERRIIHLALRDEPGVSTESVGAGDRRQVEVLPASVEDEPTGATSANGHHEHRADDEADDGDA